MKTEYKELRKKLKDEFAFATTALEYYTLGSVGQWVKHSGIKPTNDHTAIICKIHGSVPYPYQEADRTKILTYLKKNKYKDYKKMVEAEQAKFKKPELCPQYVAEQKKQKKQKKRKKDTR